ncbi:hypothetical protein K457DRAFT_827811 [Linnemannia elongata AG-77]|uniref:Uncharacterized protein n=1 Tax=Linnemannia elongata AG-77 TaxID=1314771 RepID=A0A197JHX0_9FUNG|nr:hypothetical protein K457DRAFT_827811 [Linnemannia elongata AG-77]
MAKQDAIIDHPHQAEKESATNGVCKDKQLKPQQDAVDIASLAIGETPTSGRQDNSPRLSHRPSPQQQQQRQQQQQPQPLHRHPSSGSPPTQSLSVLQEQHPLKNTTANRPTTSSPAGSRRGGEGGALVDKPFDGPSPSNSTTALAADLDPTSVQTLDNSDDTEANVGLARWHSWVTQQVKNGINGNTIDITSRQDETLEITPTSLIQYLEAVVLPLERASSLSTTDPSTSTCLATNSITNRKGATSVIETYLKPVLQLWQHQCQHKEGQQLQEQERQRQPRRYPDPSSSSSSLTLSSETKSFHESLSDDRAVVLNVKHVIRQQDQLQRLIHLEKSHQDTALVISQLQDQVQRLVDDCAHQKRLQLHSHQEKDQNMFRASDNESGSNGAVSLATLTEQHTAHRGYSSSTRRHHQRQQRQQQQTNEYYGGRGETHRAEELIEVIAKGLEEYHARATYERARQRSGTDASTAGHDHSSWRHIDLTSDNALGPLHPPQSPHDSAVDYHHYEIDTLDRSLGLHQCQSTSYYEEQSPTQLQHHHQHVQIHKQQQRLRTQHIHGENQREDLLEVPPHHPLHDRPIRSRKRSSSMSGPSGVHKDNIKLARSCSPPRPRTISDTSRTAIHWTPRKVRRVKA